MGPAAKAAAFYLLDLTGVTALAARAYRDRVPILCYHGITERRERAADDAAGLHVRRDRFEAHLDFLQGRYTVVSLDSYLDARRSQRQLPPGAVVLTFDDGFRNFRTVAACVLRARRLPATVFLIVGSVGESPAGSGERWSEQDDADPLSWEEVRSLAASGLFTFGSHACTHRRLDRMDVDEAEAELRRSLDELRRQLGSVSVPLAYPFGGFSDAVVDIARAAGYSCALTTEDGPNESSRDLFRLRRTLIGDDDVPAALAARVAGLAHLLRSARTAVG